MVDAKKKAIDDLLRYLRKIGCSEDEVRRHQGTALTIWGAALKEAETAKIFVAHIENHLKGTEIDGSPCVEKVMCKICDKDIDTIVREERFRGEK